MKVLHHPKRRERAAKLFDERYDSRQGRKIVDSLASGLNTTRKELVQRVDQDVVVSFGMDSMSIPLSTDGNEDRAKAEIEIWQVAEAVLHAESCGYLDDQEWGCLWLGELRLGRNIQNDSVRKRLAAYRAGNSDDRRRRLLQSLGKVYPNTSRCPLVLFQLMPLAVQIVVSIAFDQTDDADSKRKRQAFWLPGIMDCQACHGDVLDNGEKCDVCGNPVWNYRWLMSSD
ncbi:hypothetical protein FYK55_18010 [Roseiconus nitratireducens]|uniref:Uncharacterized protein n=1 Tax=Roseiconus nitratireducens TaxID=2605748 RepID=A0A5M6D1X8_9BACT|nr:hypothetical protein [Roseiconus nitratireducens]KAA5541458.1 hypothetical protein FYK55_18010 [Roseiconus nitratireducens]